MPEKFKARLLEHARIAIDRSTRATSEAATSQYLVLPFFQLLGYDPLNPDEVVPEAHASFSDKFRNRVDYAICKDGHPVIGIECKKVGTLTSGHIGEIKGYFNAVPTIKLGVLTDGLVWQFYSDTGRTNMMDDEPFATVDLRDVSNGSISEHQLDVLLRVRREQFDPENVGEDARRKLNVAAYLAVLERVFETPDESVVRALMDAAKMDGRRTGRLVEEHAPIVHEAMQAFLDKKILERVGFAERQDIVRVSAAMVSTTAPTVDDPTAPASKSERKDNVLEEQSVEIGSGGGIITTETELAVFEYVRQRLPFLIERDEALYASLAHLYPRDYKTTFTVCYKQDRNGRLFNFQQMAQGSKYRFEFPDTGVVINTESFADIDNELVGAYLKRVAELG